MMLLLVKRHLSSLLVIVKPVVSAGNQTLACRHQMRILILTDSNDDYVSDSGGSWGNGRDSGEGDSNKHKAATTLLEGRHRNRKATDVNASYRFGIDNSTNIFENVAAFNSLIPIASLSNMWI
jgi:hypothetical protein